MKKSLLFICLVASTINFSLFGNNVLVENVGLVNQNTSAGTNNSANYTHINFDVSWENSWRTDKGPGNWDAVWVFAKVLPYGVNDYKHATLSTNASDHVINTTNGVDYVIQPSADGKGVFMYRKNNSALGTVNWDDVELRWYYTNEGLNDTTSVTVQVFAIEMVYIPEGSFYIGDGDFLSYGSDYSFRVNNKENNNPVGRSPYLVASENAITFISSSSTSISGVYDPTSYSSGYTLLAAYPKGYAAMYCMKYEVSQKQYVDFFNTLPKLPTSSTQKSNRNLGNTGSYRNEFSWSPTTTVTDATTGSTSGDRAQNFMGWADACAYADWAALRPMSELEFEKVSRINDVDSGAIHPVKFGFPWGNTNIFNLTTGLIVNDGTSSEGIDPSTSDANALYTGGVAGPVRNGIFAAKNAPANQRQQSGASFYGVMELAGNLAEMVVSPIIPYAYYDGSTNCSTPQIAFSRNIHGDGYLNTSGNCNIPTWSNNPSYYSEVHSSPTYQHTSNYMPNNCYGKNGPNQGAIAKIRGGSYGTSSNYLRTSDRNVLPYSGYTPSGSFAIRGSYSLTSSSTDPLNANVYQRNRYQGFRAVRTAP